MIYDHHSTELRLELSTDAVSVDIWGAVTGHHANPYAVTALAMCVSAALARCESASGDRVSASCGAQDAVAVNEQQPLCDLRCLENSRSSCVSDRQPPLD